MASLLLAAGAPGHRRTLPHRCVFHSRAGVDACARGCLRAVSTKTSAGYVWSGLSSRLLATASITTQLPPTRLPACPRTGLPHSRVMLHQPSGGAQGQASDIAIAAKEILKMRELLNGLYVRHTGQAAQRVGECVRALAYWLAGCWLAGRRFSRCIGVMSCWLWVQSAAVGGAGPVGSRQRRSSLLPSSALPLFSFCAQRCVCSGGELEERGSVTSALQPTPLLLTHRRPQNPAHCIMQRRCWSATFSCRRTRPATLAWWTRWAISPFCFYLIFPDSPLPEGGAALLQGAWWDGETGCKGGTGPS